MTAVKYTFDEHIKIAGSKYILQSITKQRLSGIPHSHDFYELYFLLGGCLSHRINNSELVMNTGDCVILSPQDSHCFCAQSEDLELIALSVQYDEFSSVANVYALPPIHTAVLFSCVKRLGELRSQAVHCCHGVADNENKLLLSMLLSIYCTAQSSEQPEVPVRLANAIACMGTEDNLKVGLTALTRLTNYSYPHLYRLIKQYYGMTPHQLILQQKLDAAYSKLIHSDASVEQIAEAVGFQSVSHFIKAFRQRFGASPAKLRSQKQAGCF